MPQKLKKHFYTILESKSTTMTNILLWPFQSDKN